MNHVDAVLREIEKQASREWLPIIGADKARKIAEIVKEYNPMHALEVGTNIGYSGIVISSHMREGSHLTSIEVDPRYAKKAKENFQKAGLEDRVSVLIGDALILIPTVNGSIDFAFIDAEKHEYGRYLQLMEDKLTSGCVVIADNVGAFPNAMRDYLDHVRNSGLYESKYIQVGWDGIEVSRKL
ncbi:MAG: O-methyltransferase [Candidatus Bathyarchaeota archaeon]|nr:O-methyltransferase [Candidatus Bathyarchaeota archaeon]